MEPRAALGHYDKAEDHYTCWTTSQNPHVARLVMSAFYNVAPENKLRVIAPDVGGGFGSKIYIYPEEIVCLWASKKTGVPVKWMADRTESFLTDAHGRDHVTDVEMAFDKDNRIIGLKVDTIANLGAYMSLFSSAVPTYLYATLLSGQYDIPAIHANVRTVYTNTAPVDAYRGAGRPEATYLLERMMETAARELGVSPAELRRTNFITLLPAPDAGHHELRRRRLRRLARCGDEGGRLCRLRQAQGGRGREGGKLRGIGMSCYIEACGIAPSAAVGSLGAGVGLWESAEVRVNAVGTIEVLTGSHSHGQGHETTFAQLVTAALRRADRQRVDRPWRHRQGADGHGHLWLALRRGRHVGHRQGARQGRGQGQEDRRPPAGSRRGRHRHRERRAQGRRHRQERAVVPGGARRLHRAQPAGAAWSRA